MEKHNGITQRATLLDKLRAEAIGLDVHYTLATGERTRRIYLDSTASTLLLKIVKNILDKFQPYYANTHTTAHFGAKLSTNEYLWAHKMVLDFVQADPEDYASFFVGSGTTSGINRVARTLREKRPDRDTVIVSIMEHHSNDLPHRRNFKEIVHIPARMASNALGCVCLDRLEQALKEHKDRVNYVAVTGVSNVTGMINPIYDIAELAHKHGALIVVDAAQMAAHVPIKMSGHSNPARDIDMLIFSGHKIYAPGSPGAVITRKEHFSGVEPVEVGGGMVKDVFVNRYIPVEEFPDREEAGTPNICGAIALGTVLYTLKKIGMDYIEEDECELIEYALGKLQKVDDLILYGETDCQQCKRAGAISFNIRKMDHALTASILNDYFNISVRNACFCAHPYVREMIIETLAEEAENLTDEELEMLAELHRGMVRASIGIYNTREDIDALVAALRQVAANKEFYRDNYVQLADGNFEHKIFGFDHTKLFSVRGVVDAWVEGTYAK
ncbi:MAG: aminotransferase class V-fold PLP-dependent enzyme [bacterium]